jgi:hypothetical protein
VILQAFIDDSRSVTGDKEFVLAGYMTTAPQWMKFADEWEGVLFEPPRIDSFHMVDARGLTGGFEGWNGAARDKKILRLAAVIERCTMMSFDCRVSQASFNRILLLSRGREGLARLHS